MQFENVLKHFQILNINLSSFLKTGKQSKVKKPILSPSSLHPEICRLQMTYANLICFTVARKSWFQCHLKNIILGMQI